jgi:hypothetical protein
MAANEWRGGLPMVSDTAGTDPSVRRFINRFHFWIEDYLIALIDSRMSSTSTAARHWCKAQANWEYGSGATAPSFGGGVSHVSVKDCDDITGAGETGDAFDVKILSTHGEDPGIQAGDVFPYGVMNDGDKVVLGFGDRSIGAIEWNAQRTTALREWGVAKGVENATLLGGSGADLTDRYFCLWDIPGNLLNTGGSATAAVSDHAAADIAAAIDDHPAGVTGFGGDHSHSITASGAHTHSGTANTTALTLDPGGGNVDPRSLTTNPSPGSTGSTGLTTGTGTGATSSNTTGISMVTITNFTTYNDSDFADNGHDHGAGDPIWAEEDFGGISVWDGNENLTEVDYANVDEDNPGHRHSVPPLTITVTDLGHSHPVTGSHSHPIILSSHDHTVGAHVHVVSPNPHDHTGSHTHAISPASHSHSMTIDATGSQHDHTTSTDGSHQHSTPILTHSAGASDAAHSPIEVTPPWIYLTAAERLNESADF